MSSMPNVESFHDPATGTFTHVVYDHHGGRAAIIDPVLDYDAASARTGTASADRLLAFASAHGLGIDWLLETHVHADHLTAAGYLKRRTGALTAAGRGVTAVQAHGKALFNLGDDFATDGSQFDRLFADGESFAIGELTARVRSAPGHTSDSLVYLVGDAAFIGDTLFAPDTGSARSDFPGGDAHALYRSVQAILALPDGTRLFLCHDYPPAGRAATACNPVEEQRAHNVHLGGGVGEEAFVAMRSARDATLAAPKLVLPALQVNLRAGELPPADADGVRYLRLPLDRFGRG